MSGQRERVPYGSGGHARNGLGICVTCGNGTTGRDILDGELPCAERFDPPLTTDEQRRYLIHTAHQALEAHDRRMRGGYGGRGIAPAEIALAVALRGVLTLAVRLDSVDEETISRLILGRTAPTAARAVTTYLKGAEQ